MIEDNIRKGMYVFLHVCIHCTYIYAHAYIEVGHLVVQQKLAQHCKSTIIFYKTKKKEF